MNSFIVRLIFFIIWPFLMTIYSIFNWRKKGSKFFILLFCLLFAYTFIIANDSMDAYVYASLFFDYKLYDFIEFVNSLTQEAAIDFIVPCLIYFAGYISDNYSIMFLFFAIPFSIYMIKSVDITIDKSIISDKFLFVVLVILFVFVNPITNINVIRYYLATWVFFYYAIKSFQDSNKLYFCSIFIHWSFVIPIFIFEISRKVIIKEYILILLVIISVLFSFDSSFMFNISEVLGGKYISKTDVYAGEHGIDKLNQRGIESSFLYNFFIDYSTTLFLLILMYVRKKIKIKYNTIPYLIYSNSLLFFIFTHIFKGVYSVHRFNIFVLLFGLYFIINNFNTIYYKYNRYIIFPLLLLLVTMYAYNCFIIARLVVNPFIFYPIPFVFL